MPLPDLIEIIPLEQPVRAEITVPGSKSITNRMLVLAALAGEEVTLQGALWSEDTQVMVECLGRLGFELRVEQDANEFCNRTITVRGRGGEIPKSGTPDHPLELFVGNAGTAARFLSAMVCLGRGAYRLSGVPRMHERPQASLFTALRELGYRVESPNDHLPALIHGSGPRSARCKVSMQQSSQFASALMLCNRRSQWQVEVVDYNAEESPYVAMTNELVSLFDAPDVLRFLVEPDASSGSYFWAANTLLNWGDERTRNTEVAVRAWPRTTWQIDARFREYARPEVALNRAEVSRALDLGDSVMTAIVMAPLEPRNTPKRFTHLGRLRVQECERVIALRTELTKCGANVVESGDTLEVKPSALHGSEIETYNDHRMAMCFAVLGLRVPGIKLRNPSCVKKTFPNFFQKLAAAPPFGLGATILDGNSGRPLAPEMLFAD